MPEECDQEDMQKKYENLRRMPFSLNEEAEPFNSPFNKILSSDDDDKSQSLEIELKNEDELANLYESNIFQSFEIFEDENLSHDPHHHHGNDSEFHTKTNKVFDRNNLYLNLSNKMSYNKDDANNI